MHTNNGANKTLDKGISLQFPYTAKYYLPWGNSLGRMKTLQENLTLKKRAGNFKSDQCEHVRNSTADIQSPAIMS